MLWEISLVPVGVGEVGPGVVGQVPGVGGQVYPGVGGQELKDLALLWDFPRSIFSSVQETCFLWF